MDADNLPVAAYDLHAAARRRYARILSVQPEEITDRALLYLTTYAKSDASVVSLWRTISGSAGEHTAANDAC